MLLVYDNVFNENPEKEIKFIESILVNTKSKEEYSYKYLYEEGEVLRPIRRIYQVESLEIEELFRQISLSDFGGEYDLTSSIFIIDIESKTIFYLYDDRGVYIRAKKEEVLQNLWKSMPDSFFEDCNDFEIKIKKLYWLDRKQDNEEDLCLYGDLEIRLNNQIVEHTSIVNLAGLKLLRSLLKDHHRAKGDALFPSSRNTRIVTKKGNKPEIIACPKGLDWSIIHKDALLTIDTGKNLKTTYYYMQYKKEVLNFIKEVENFYKNSEKIDLEKDKINREEYLAFFEEWKDLKNQVQNKGDK